ncbi:YceI family protein [Sunxiuqinia sp. A32]|uniref:YceI family protein n=1 Tax=Sunxiuqinia sp. A32 TaxID=3461496 RepID=UPI0040466E16
MKTRIKVFKKSVLVALFVSLVCLANAQDQYRIDATNSSMTVEGTSTIHDWEMEVGTVNGQLTFGEESSLESLSSGNLIVDVESLKSDHSLMNKKTYEALKEKSHPQIIVTLVRVLKNENPVMAEIDVTIAGKTKRLQEDFSIKDSTEGKVVIEGDVTLTLADFGVNPPVALMGTIKTGGEVTVKYNLTYQK